MLGNYCIFVIFWIFWISKRPRSTFFPEKEGALAALYLDVKHAWNLVALDQAKDVSAFRALVKQMIEFKYVSTC